MYFLFVDEFNRGMMRIQSVSTEINDVRKIYEHAIQVKTNTVEPRYVELGIDVALDTI
jgi:hypothetical protein